MYRLHFDDRVARQIVKLPKLVRDRILQKLDQAKLNPHYYFKKLTGRKEYKLRVGDYRIIADILDDKIVIFVLEVKHRKNAYKKT